MNFLAHLWLADRSRTSLAGAILGDVIRGTDLSMYPDDIAHGIRLHRRIDAATDRHPLIAAARSRFAPGERRYAGIVLDLACDHVLSRDWTLHAEEPFAEFCQRAATAVAAAGGWFERGGGRPPDADGFAALLESYGEADGMRLALQRIAGRVRAPDRLLQAAADWPHHAQRLQPQLGALLQDLLRLMH
ncbi:ACP phosphodiesterase [Fontimonas sp. SYSU GA230001]|uniref:acyl carrier protein phosphodiesterase n=1 Tax=Fontimonas sp. SYSU GA230001 TaxID=3142450 RepID=UPI0032B54652